jgi:hypothetical protein
MELGSEAAVLQRCLERRLPPERGQRWRRLIVEDLRGVALTVRAPASPASKLDS